MRPQHANSKQILFGGTLMRWTEEVSTIAARRVFPSASWSSAAIDSLTFKTAVELGEVVYVRAAVLKVYDSSVEVAAIVTCEDRNSAQPKVRQVSESFLTLVRPPLSSLSLLHPRLLSHILPRRSGSPHRIVLLSARACRPC